jgi:hypothetical protein
MRLNPFGLKFLGLLPPQPLVMFERVIYPLVAWVNRQHRFYPNWEVEKVVYLPLRDLLNPENYARCRLHMEPNANSKPARNTRDYPCFPHRSQNQTELLWGATYRITTHFLEYSFGFSPPGMASLPVVDGRLDENYLTGKQKNRKPFSFFASPRRINKFR